MTEEMRHKLIEMQIKEGVPPERAAANVARTPKPEPQPLAPLGKFEQAKRAIADFGRRRYWWE